MKPFDYIRAEDTGHATSAAAQGATIIAGGTNLLDLMKLEVMQPDALIDINRLELKEISEVDGGLRIGTLVTNSDLAADMRVRESYPMLSQALLAGRLWPVAQQGDDRRQPAATHAVLLLL